MNLFIAGPHAYKCIFDKKQNPGMDLYPAAPHSQYQAHFEERRAEADTTRLLILESYHYYKSWMDPHIAHEWEFMFDSGAFTYMQGTAHASDPRGIDWGLYIEDYARHINRLHVKLFFELDIDCVVGLGEVERLRNYLEKLTNRQCIPVWHKSRGLDKFKEICKSHSYVAIGGIVSKEFTRKDYKHFNTLCRIAHDNDTKIHGLGFTPGDGSLESYEFDSVDSTSWVYGNMAGFYYTFKGNRLTKTDMPKGKRMKARAVSIHNFNQWAKYQHYLRERS